MFCKTYDLYMLLTSQINLALSRLSLKSKPQRGPPSTPPPSSTPYSPDPSYLSLNFHKPSSFLPPSLISPHLFRQGRSTNPPLREREIVTEGGPIWVVWPLTTPPVSTLLHPIIPPLLHLPFCADPITPHYILQFQP